MTTDAIGWVALVLTQVFWIPNIGRIIRTRDVEGYSLLAWFTMVAGLSGWLLYFSLRGDLVGIVANICGVAGAVITTFLILRWRRRAHLHPVAEPLPEAA